jgi:hypothetical protein
MGLSITFECPQCRKIIPRQLTELSPVTPQQCPDCNAPAHLTDPGLKSFRRALQEFCRP